MFADFLPASVADIQDAEAIALLQHVQRCMVPVRSQSGTTAIATAFVRSVAEPASAVPNTAPVLLLHGFDSSLLEFRRLFPALAARCQTWALDLLGAGFTENSPTLEVNPQTIRQHLLGVLETCIQQPVMLVGASLGGAVAIDFVLHYPNWVRSLVLIDSVGFSGSFPVGPFLPAPLIDLGADWLYWRKRAALLAASMVPAIDPALADALRCSLVHQEMPGWKGAIASFTKSGGYANLSAQISHITHPTLILWGDTDDVLGTADAMRFEQALRHSQLVWVKGAGHVPHFEMPQIVADHLKSFAQMTNNE